MVNIGLITGGGVIIGGVVVLLTLLYQEYQRNQRSAQRQSYEARPEGSKARAPPQPANECTICRDDISVPLEILPCGHLFHKKCIKQWLSLRMICPVCRARIADDLALEYSRRLGL